MPITVSYRSRNYNTRPEGARIRGLVLHSSEGAFPSDRAWLCNPASEVSSHYLIAPEGTIYQLVDDAKRAWHAGVGTFQGISDWNSASIGIEISHQAGQPYPAVQLASLRDLCRTLIARYQIEQRLVVAHRWIAPTRKSDPTDFPDPTLRAWIAGLYAHAPATAPVLDSWSAWGDAHPLPPEQRLFGIPQTWLTHRDALGAAISPVEYADDGRTCMQFFAGGLIVVYRDIAHVTTWQDLEATA